MITKPGTATLEIALLGTPFVVAARANALTRRDRAARDPRAFAHDGEPDRGRSRSCPSSLQEAARPERIAAAVRELLAGPAGARQRRRLAELRERLRRRRCRATRGGDRAGDARVGPLGHSLAALARRCGAAAAARALLAARPGAARTGSASASARGPPAPAGCVWVHGASVGEIRAATRLLDALAARGVAVAASTIDASRAATCCGARGPACPAASRPSTTRGASAARLAPRAASPRWSSSRRSSGRAGSSARARAAPRCAIVSGRISDRSFPRYRRAGALVRPVLAPSPRSARAATRTPSASSRSGRRATASR